MSACLTNLFILFENGRDDLTGVIEGKSTETFVLINKWIKKEVTFRYINWYMLQEKATWHSLNGTYQCCCGFPWSNLTIYRCHSISLTFSFLKRSVLPVTSAVWIRIVMFSKIVLKVLPLPLHLGEGWGGGSERLSSQLPELSAHQVLREHSAR